MNKKYNYLAKNTIVFAIGSFGTKFLSFFLVPLYTNILSTEEYGVADLITTTATLLIFVFSLNICDGVLRYVLERKTEHDEILAYGIKVLLGGSFLLSVLLIFFYLLKLVNWPLIYFFFVFLSFFSTALYQILTNYLRAIDKAWDVAIAGIVSTVVIISCNIIFLLLIKTGIYGYIVSLIAGPAVASVYALIRTKVSLVKLFNSRLDKETKVDIVRYCLPLIFNNSALWINAFLDKYFVTFFCGVDQNGIYAISYKIPTILSTCFVVFSQAWSLSAVKEFDKDDRDGFFFETYTVYGALISFVTTILIILNIPLAHFLYAKDFFEAWKYSSILIISSMFNAYTIYLGSIFTAVKRTKIIAITTVISAGCNVILNIILIPRFEVYGAAMATLASYFVMWLVRLVFSKKYISFSVNFGKTILVFVLLVMQVFVEHTEKHGYILQMVLCAMVILCYSKQVVHIVQYVRNTLRKR